MADPCLVGTAFLLWERACSRKHFSQSMKMLNVPASSRASSLPQVLGCVQMCEYLQNHVGASLLATAVVQLNKCWLTPLLLLLLLLLLWILILILILAPR